MKIKLWQAQIKARNFYQFLTNKQTKQQQKAHIAWICNLIQEFQNRF